MESSAATQRNIADMVGPCSSSRWNPELDCMVVGLSIFTFGSAAATGTDGFAPIFEIPNVDCCDLGGDLDVGGSC